MQVRTETSIITSVRALTDHDRPPRRYLSGRLCAYHAWPLYAASSTVEKQSAEENAHEASQVGAEALYAAPGDTLQKTADLLGNLFRTSKEEADKVQRGHEKKVRNALEQEKSGQVRPNQK